MSTVSKGPCRIPKLGSRRPPIQPTSATTSTTVPEITANHIGKRVRISEKEGILRFLGNVHFAKGTWCGIELNASLGKNDGIVHGVRYFACSQRCGLMVPLSKVTLLEVNNCESLSDNASGPYSMLFIDNNDLTRTVTYHNEQQVSNKPFTKNLNDTGHNKGASQALERLEDATFNVQQLVNETLVVRKEGERRELLKTFTAEVEDNWKKPSEVCKKRSNDTFHPPDVNATILNDKDQTDLPFLPLDSTSDDSSSVEAKRRRTTDVSVESNDVTTATKPISLPQLKSCVANSLQELAKFAFSTPNHKEFKERKLRISSIHAEDDSDKRDSLEFEESLGILTPDQMVEGAAFVQTRSPSLEYDVNAFKVEPASPRKESLGLLDDKKLPNSMDVPSLAIVKEEVPSPTTDYSLGIIDENIIANLTMRTDATMNMKLTLTSLEKSILDRLEQTPSPEELPLDPTPSDPKTEPSTSKACNSFITSITSITSLDTGYQGDGEMSRPASRGTDTTSLTRRSQVRHHDPMTDSDFYTESEADNNDENNHLGGDRRAQVIDGTLYGVDAQTAADIYANNRETMDSSGIFTDLERNDDATEADDASPSDTTSKTISENSQDNLQDVLDKTIETNNKVEQLRENPKKRNAPSPGVSITSSFSSPRHHKEANINSAKKYKMPKRDVASKVKAFMETNKLQAGDKKIAKKPVVGRWDAVMTKISKGDQTKTSLKEVKSKVFNEVGHRLGDDRKVGGRTNASQKSPSNKLLVSPKVTLNGRPLSSSSKSHTTPDRRHGSVQSLPSAEKRRNRNRPTIDSPSKTIGTSIHSSLSDLSAATLPPTNKSTGSAKKRTNVVQVTQVLTTNKLSPKNQQNTTAAENKKNATHHAPPTIQSNGRKTIFSPKEKNKQATNKECARATVKGGRASPSVRPPTQTRVHAKQPPVAEALAVLVQHLVFNVEAYQVPTLKRQIEKYRSEAEEVRLICQHLEEDLAQEKTQQTRSIEEERIRCRKDITELIENHRKQLAEITSKYSTVEQENQTAQHQIDTLKKEFARLQRTHEESLDILREENESIREQIDEKQAEIERVEREKKKLKEEHLVEVEHNCKLRQQWEKLQEENKVLRNENDRLLGYGDDKGIGVKEVQSLRAVLELKQQEVAELRRALGEATHRAEVLEGAEEKARLINARCEDLQLQLQRKAEFEQNLLQENQRLHESFKEETNQKRRLCQHNEELQWKLKQNKEVISKVLEQAEETVFNRSLLSSSFNERHNTSSNSARWSLERTLSCRERKSKNSQEFDAEEDVVSPPTSPKVKGVVEKSDSVSYVLEMDDSPDIVANRIVRRSFRSTSTTTAKSTPTKSPSNKRARIRNPLSQSMSSSAIISTNNKTEHDRPRSASSRNNGSDSDANVFVWTSSPKYDEPSSYASSTGSSKLDEDPLLDLDEDNDEVDNIPLPALPSELNGTAQPLPSPKHLAGEAMESNSEDEESTSSSQL